MGNESSKAGRGKSGGGPAPSPTDSLPDGSPASEGLEQVFGVDDLAADGVDGGGHGGRPGLAVGGHHAGGHHLGDVGAPHSPAGGLYMRQSLARQAGTNRPITVDDFELLRVIGKGSFGKVFMVRKRGGRDAGAVYAMKALRKEVLLRRNQIEHTRSERAILEAVHHPFIVALRYAFQTRDKLYIVTDFASGGELFFWLKRDRVFSQARARLYAAELVLALESLHDLDIVYRDLKPENILLDADGHIKLTDFGLSKMDVRGSGPEGGTQTFCGTPEYLAPEILENTGHGKAVDWWSLGTLLYEMMAGLPPFYDTNVELMYEKILTSELRFPRHFLPETRSLLAGMLTRRVEDRLGYRGAGEIKAHPFFAGLDWGKAYARRYRPEFVPPPNGLVPVAVAVPVEVPPSADADGAVDTEAVPPLNGEVLPRAGSAAPIVRIEHQLMPVVSNFEDEFTREEAVLDSPPKHGHGRGGGKGKAGKAAGAKNGGGGGGGDGGSGGSPSPAGGDDEGDDGGGGGAGSGDGGRSVGGHGDELSTTQAERAHFDGFTYVGDASGGMLGRSYPNAGGGGGGYGSYSSSATGGGGLAAVAGGGSRRNLMPEGDGSGHAAAGGGGYPYHQQQQAHLLQQQHQYAAAAQQQYAHYAAQQQQQYAQQHAYYPPQQGQPPQGGGYSSASPSGGGAAAGGGGFRPGPPPPAAYGGAR